MTNSVEQTGLKTDLSKLAVTFVIALSVGYFFVRVGFPAPYMLGSLFGVWVFGGLIKPLRPHLGVARWFHKPVVVLLATLIGGTFNQEMLGKVTLWWPTILLMLAATAVATVVGFLYMVGFRKHDPKLALLCCLPGGQAEVIVMARELTEKDYVVALCHLVRVLIVFLATPAILAFVTGVEGVAKSNVVQASMTSIFDLNWIVLGEFVLLGLVGFGFGKIARLPIPHLLGPLIVSSLAHSMGWVEIPRIGEFVIMAQLTIAGAVGARLCKVPVRELASYLIDAVINAVLIVSTFILIAYGISLVLGIEFIHLLLAFIPGGLYEVTLLALIFGYDVAFVAFHHAIRILLIFFSLPLLIKLANKFTPKSVE